MDTKDWLTVSGWAVTFGLGVLSGGVIVPKLTRKRKLIAWAVVSENEIVPRQLSAQLGVPVLLQVGNETPNSLSVVKIKVGGGGNEVIESANVKLLFNSSAQVLNVKLADDVGEYARHISWIISKQACTVKFDFLNPKLSVEFDILLSDYDIGSATADVAGPGLELRRRDPGQWDIPSSVFRTFGISLFGLRYDPAAVSMTEIATELKALRSHLQKK